MKVKKNKAILATGLAIGCFLFYRGKGPEVEEQDIGLGRPTVLLEVQEDINLPNTIDPASLELVEPIEVVVEEGDKSGPPITLAAEIEEQIEAIEVLAEVEEETFITVQARVTAYAPLDNQSGICAEGDPTITATGAKVRRGIIAVDPKKIPYGTKVYIPGYGEAVAEDTGGALRNYDGIAIDILVDSYSEAIEWGKQYLEVIIYE